jgi:Na+/proline symporter
VSPWYVVAFGMIGDSLSGVTFISLPGTVASNQFGYMQMVLGYMLGYILIAKVLLPLYYSRNLTSIYSFLHERFGTTAQKTGSFYFLLSRTLGAALRLGLAAGVVQTYVFDHWGIPDPVTVAGILGLMLLYTYRGGIRTLVWTDSLQSALLLLGLICSVWAVADGLHLSPLQLARNVQDGPYAQIFFWDWKLPSYFWKQFISGALITLVMTGLDQNMMQKNLSMRNLKEAQKNMYWFSASLIFVNLLFLSLGAVLYAYLNAKGLQLPVDPTSGKILTDRLFPMLALNHLGVFAALVFMVGLTAATFSSADSVLTTLTTSFCIDILGHSHTDDEGGKEKRMRQWVHIGFAVLLWLVILISKVVAPQAVIFLIFSLASYTYGPLLGLFAFGIISKRQVQGSAIPYISIAAPVMCYILDSNSKQWLGGYTFSFELLLVNGLLVMLGLRLFSKKTALNTWQSPA